jgi:hypothetical protein
MTRERWFFNLAWRDTVIASRLSIWRRTASQFAVLVFGTVLAAWVHADGSNVSGGGTPLLVQVVPQAVTAGQARLVGSLKSAQRLKLAIHLPAQNQAALNMLLQQLQDPSSPSYHKYLSVDEFTAQFGPSQADYDAVVAWAKAQGLTVTGTARNRHLVDVEGSVDDINAALHIVMSSFQRPDVSVKSQFYAPDREPTVNLSVQLLEITGLDNFSPPQRKLKQGSPSDIAGAIANATGSGPGGIFFPSDMRAAYYGNGPLTGAGQTIGIFSFDGYIDNDVPLYYSLQGIPNPNVPVTNVLVGGYSGVCDAGDGSGTSPCDDGEQVLDIVNSVGMAPGVSQVIFYEGLSGPDILNQMAIDNLAKVISCSWGSGDLGGDDVYFEEMQAQGQTFLNATGDDGAYNAATWLPPSLNPLVLQVGGSDLTTDPTNNQAWVSETGWRDSGGGFFSVAGYSIPNYQQLAGVISDNGATPNNGSQTLRNDPDVAAEANFDNPVISNGVIETGFGGTSFAAPRWAGYITLLNEQSETKGASTVGFINSSLYTIGLGANYATNFHDIISGSNKPTMGGGTGFTAVPGYDLVTGWGSPNGSTLLDSLSTPPVNPGFVISGVPSIQYVTQNSSVDTTVAVGSSNMFVDDVTLTVSGLPDGVTASFSSPTANPSTTATSTLTLTTSATATIGPATITITGAADNLTRSTSVNLFVGNPPALANVTPNLLTFTSVPLGFANASMTIANGPQSVPLTYTIAAFASSDGSCTGAVPWLTVAISGGTVFGGQPTSFNIGANPAGTLPVGDYAAEICVDATNDASPHGHIVIPVDLTIIPGPRSVDSIFRSGFETGESNVDPGVFTFVVPGGNVEDDLAGSSIDLATGSFHTFSSALLDNINLYDDGTGLQVYWYNDVVPRSFRTKVGGFIAASTTDYALLQSGAVIGPPATNFTNATSPLTNFQPGVDGYIGIAFLNSQTNALNYGYIHVTTTGPNGFPAQVLDYGFDNTGAAITIP